MELLAGWPEFAAVQAKLLKLLDPDLTPVMLGLMGVIGTDNRDGLLAGTDKDGAKMPTTVRERTPEGYDVFYKLPDGKTGHYYQAGRSGDHPEDGDGPPLAPHGIESRAITNLKVEYHRDGPDQWVAQGAWKNVLSDKGVPFLPFHFRGEGRLPTRDLAGLRPDGRDAAVALVDSWVTAMLAGDEWTAPAPKPVGA
jgi:hypothetical protein